MKTISLLKAVLSEDMNLFKYTSGKNASKINKAILPIVLFLIVMFSIGYYAYLIAEPLHKVNLTYIMLSMFIFIISIIVVILVSLCTIAGTYAVIINVTNENGVDKITNNINIRDLLTNDNGTYNNTYYQVKGELNITEEEMNKLMESEPLNNKLKLVLDSIVKYKLRNDKTARYNNDELYSIIEEGTNDTPNIDEELKNKVITTSDKYKQDISDFLYDIEVSLIEG